MANDDTSSRGAPPSRRERQEQTRAALIDAARAVFAQEGYHGASLEAIAHEAGFSKGAVYSNFEGKAALFLAVLDANLAMVGTQAWDPFDEPPPEPAAADDAEGAEMQQEIQQAIRGFGLATLEFIAAAGRDPALSAELAGRMQAMREVYTAVATEHRSAEDPLPPEQLGALLAALDQGVTVLTLSGSSTVDHQLLRTGLRRLLDPARAVAAAASEARDGTRGEPALHDDELQRRLVRSVQADSGGRGTSEADGGTTTR